MPEKFAPARWRPEPALTGPATPLVVDVVHHVDGAGAEDVLVRPDGRVVTGVADGRIFAVNPDNGSFELVADTSGRPLGIEQHPDGGLVVCDANLGLLYVSPDGDVRTLYDEGLTFTNNAAVAADGTIYFSDSSSRFGVAEWMGDVIEHQRTGRLLRRTPDGQVDVVADNFAFANGVALAPDESFVVVAQTSEYDLQRITLTGPDQEPEPGSAEPSPASPTTSPPARTATSGSPSRPHGFRPWTSSARATRRSANWSGPCRTP
ncbi:hypothetical protein GCM10029964_003250 [Kibdelosporangium lantanae]